LANASLLRAMEEVGRLSKAEIVWLNDVGEETVSVDFIALPFPEALERLLRGKNFLLFYSQHDDGEKLSRVWISSRPDKKIKPPGQGLSVVARHLVARSSEVTQTGQRGEERTEGEFSFSSLSTDEIVQVALGEKNPSFRLDAIALLGQEAYRNPHLKKLLARIAREDADPTVRHIAAQTLGETTE